MNAELDTAVAREVMQWTVLTPDRTGKELEELSAPSYDLSRFAVMHPEPLGLQHYKLRRGDGYEIWEWHPWHPSSDIAAAHEMEAEIERRGLGNRYAVHLVNETQTNTLFGLLRATPEQRCRAALGTIRGVQRALEFAQAAKNIVDVVERGLGILEQE